MNAPALTAAERMRRTRERRRRGFGTYRVEVEAVGLEEMLVSDGYLAGWDTDDARSVEAALSRWLSDLLRRNAEDDSAAP